jgi:hypothetical protein
MANTPKLNKILTKEILVKEYLNKSQVSAIQIAKKFNCSSASVIAYLRKYNIPVRTVRECLLGKVLHKKNCNCLFCQGKRGELTKNKNPNFRHGKNCYPNYCLDCGKLIDKCGRSIRCPKCEHIAHPNFKGKKHTKANLKIIGKKSKAKFTKEFIKRVYTDRFKGTKHRSINGYILVKSYSHKDRNNHDDVLEHRLVMEKKIGRRLKKKEIVHHIDENRENNKKSNLYLCKNRSEHGIVHSSFLKLLPLLFQTKTIIFKQGNYMINPKGVLGSHRKGVN